MKPAKPKTPTLLSIADKSALLNDGVFYEIIFALGVSSYERTDYCAWEHVNFSRMGHARALIYFFECGLNTKKWDDDLISEDFGFAARPIGISQEDRSRLNKDLFHLSSSRLRHTSKTKPWPDDILNRVHERSIDFVKFLLGASHHHGFNVAVSNWTALLESLESGRESIIARPINKNGPDAAWRIGKGRKLVSRYIGLTLPETKA